MSTQDFVKICRYRHNCFYEVTSQAWLTFKVALKIYSIVHLIQTLLYKRKTILKEPKNTLIVLLKKILKSVAFMTSICVGVKFSMCFSNWLKDGKWDNSSVWLLIFMSSFGSLFEPSSRVTEYAVFTYTRSLEGLFDLAVKLNLLKPIPFGRGLIYAISIGLALIIYKHHKEDIPHSYNSIVKAIFGEDV